MLLLVIVVVSLCMTAVHGRTSLSEDYRFQRELSDDETSYVLHWSFDLEAGTISFAVNVSTTGWVGFGLSPNGQMPLSDMVIGWVDNEGQPQFQDRFAEGRFEPKVDTIQDWFLTAHSEEDGRTILEFRRALVTCDADHDIAITTDTSRIVWSYGAEDPEKITGIGKHDAQGSFSINLLGGLNEDRLVSESEEMYFDIRNDNLVIPTNTTTYWCKLFELPANIVNSSSEHFVYKISPILTPHDRDYVHHLVVFLCPIVNSTGFSGNCEIDPPFDILICTNTKVFGSWAVGGREFIFPNDVGFPIGTNKNEFAVVLEVHYDNPESTPDILDSSGMRFYYTATPPKHRAGIMTLGHDISSQMVVPPTSDGYTTSGICAPSCTSTHFPSDGITVFGNIFHTHLIGASVKLRHYTKHDKDCEGWKELEPIDQNLHYDFNYQQYNILPKSKKVMPGDVMDLECVYRSSRQSVTLGGLSTKEEMCLSFIAYYPKLDLSVCVSRPSLTSFQLFTDKYTSSESQEIIEHLNSSDHIAIASDFNAIDWTPVALGDLESYVRSGNLTQLCVVNIGSEDNFKIALEEVPIPSCPYQPPPQKCLSPDGFANSQVKSASACLFSATVLAFLAIKIV